MAISARFLRPEPGAAGPLRRARIWLGTSLWGSDRRRTVVVVAGVCLLVAFALVYARLPALRLFQAAVFGATALAIILKPHIGVLALVGYRLMAGALNLEEIISRLGVTGIKSLGLLTLAGFLGVVVLKRARPSFGHREQALFILGLFFANLLSSFAAFSFTNVWIHIFQFLQNAILYFLFVNLYTGTKWLRRYMWLTAGLIVVTEVSGLASLSAGEIRIAGTVGNPNGLALVANQGLAIFLVAALFERLASRRFLLLAGLSFGVVTILFTGSRGGILAAVVTFAYQMMKRRRSLIPYLVGVVALAAAFALVPEVYKERQTVWFEKIFSGDVEETTGGSRGFIYRSAFDLWKRSPIIGIGPRTFGTLYQEEFAYRVKGTVSRVRVVHSGVLEILVENGIIGFGFFAGLIIVTFVVFNANARMCRAAGRGDWLMLNAVFEAMFLAGLVSGAFETILKANTFWLGVACAAVVNRAVKPLAAGRERDAAAALAAPRAAPPP